LVPARVAAPGRLRLALRHTLLMALALPCGAGCGGGGTVAIPTIPKPTQTADVFAEDVLHYAELSILPGDLALLVPFSDLRVRCTLVYDGVELTNVGVKLKGGTGSARPLGEKPGFSFKTNEFVKGQSLHGMKKFVLNNAVQDPSFLSELVAYEIWRRAGVPARRASHVRVRLNGAYLGVYVVAESYEGGFLDRTFADGKGNLYEGAPGVDLSDVDALELDTNTQTNDRSDLVALAAVLLATPDEEFAAALEGVLDVEEFLRYWAVEALLDHWDGYAAQSAEDASIPGPNNYYAYHDPSTGLFSLLPWGADQCLVRAGSSVLAPPQPLSLLAHRCFQDANLRARYVDHLRSALAAWDAEELGALVTAAYERIAGSVSEGDQNPAVAFATFRAAVTSLRSFLRTRPATVLSQLGD